MMMINNDDDDFDLLKENFQNFEYLQRFASSKVFITATITYIAEQTVN